MYREFRIQMRLYLKSIAKDVTHDDDKITTTLSFMKKDHAATWKNRFVEDHFGPSQTMPSYVDFCSAMDDRFLDTNIQTEAFLKLRALKQGKKTADEYTAEFRDLAAEAKIREDHSLIDHYQFGLNAPIVDRIFMSDTIPTKFEEWVKKALNHDQNYRNRLAMKSLNHPLPSHPTRKASATTKDPNAMDVDKTKIKKLSQKERDDCVAQGKCF